MTTKQKIQRAGLLVCWLFLSQTTVLWAEAIEPDMPYAAIYRWVAAEMGVEPIWPMPVIHEVDHSTLETCFKTVNHRVYPLLSAKYGVSQAQAILARYMNELAGLYAPRTKTIYIGRFLNPCRRQAVLAHEICHFFQFQSENRASGHAVSSQMEQLTRELAAQRIEKHYMDRHCSEK